MKEQLIIVNAGPFGCETYFLARNLESRLGPDCPFEIKGFLDDRGDLLKKRGSLEDMEILSSVENYEPEDRDCFVCALGEPSARYHYAGILEEKGGRFGQLIDPTALVTGTRKDLEKRFKPGVVVGPLSVISADVLLGEHTMICNHATLGHDVEVGPCCHIGAFVFVGGGVKIGSRVTIHPHATILPGTVIEDEATVGAGSVVIRRVGRNQTVFGVPAVPVEK